MSEWRKGRFATEDALFWFIVQVLSVIREGMTRFYLPLTRARDEAGVVYCRTLKCVLNWKLRGGAYAIEKDTIKSR
jgi:hypothetical protein